LNPYLPPLRPIPMRKREIIALGGDILGLLSGLVPRTPKKK
jgi:hypothetical protein